MGQGALKYLVYIGVMISTVYYMVIYSQTLRNKYSLH